jgi:tetratricopeptide (TPR) repeat protein
MILPLIVASAVAATPEDIAHGWYLAESGRLSQATWLAAEALSENPHDLQAHRLYTWCLKEGIQDGAALELQYRAWQQAEPENEYARVALSGLLVGLNEEAGEWCEEIETLLDPMPKDTGVAYWAHRYRYAARGICPADQAEDRTALLELAKVTPSALGFSLRLRMAEGKVDEALASDLQTFYTLEPWNMAFPGNLWGDDAKGPGLKAARTAALDAARVALEADGPAYAQGAFRIFAQAGNDAGRVAAETRRAELDPAWSTLDRDWNGERLSLTEGGRSALERALERARHKASVEAARSSLQALEPAIPPHGPLRSIFLREQAYIHYRAGDEDAAFAAFEAAWQEDPGNASAANGFAYLAALRGQKLDLALVVMDSILEQNPTYDPWELHAGSSYQAWATRERDQVAARLDTRAWILHQIDRTEEAASVLQRALLLMTEPDPILYHHLGLILLDLDKRDAALEAFGRGLALGPSAEVELDALARETAQGLFTEHRWAPGGLDAWVAAHTPPRKAPASRAGERLPDLELLVDDKPRMLSDFEGVRVVVFWSARSTPFVDSLPYWTELSKRYHKDPVHFLGLCVDERQLNTTEFWQGYRLPPLLLGWAGPAGAAAAGVESPPTALVIDAQGVIRGQLVGQVAPDDGRMQDWIDALLAEAWAAREGAVTP